MGRTVAGWDFLLVVEVVMAKVVVSGKADIM